MKKFATLLLLSMMCFSLIAGGSQEEKAKDSSASLALKQAENMTNEELFEKAKSESGTMKIYSTTSLCGKAVESFMKKYPGLRVEYSSVSETDMFTKLTTEIGSAAEGADMALLQNAYMMQSLLIDEGLVLNYVPSSIKPMIDDDYENPLAVLFVNKLFLWNNTAGDINLNNIWQLAEPDYKNKVFFKDPSSEPVGMNFLIMLTSPEWVSRVEKAYLDYYGKEWKNPEYKNASYEWIDKFLSNCSFEYTADGGICTGVTNGKPGNVGLFVFSKLRGNEAARKNLTPAYDIEGFSGFMYPTYAQVCSDTDMPYTCALFINYILSEEGSNPWTNEGVMGNYSSNTSVPLNDGTGLDRSVDFWNERCVVEDGAYLSSSYAEVFEFISVRIK